MPKPPVTREELRERKQRSRIWRLFRKEFNFRQTDLAERLEINVRTIQAIEAGTTTPLATTQRKFATLKSVFESRRSYQPPVAWRDEPGGTGRAA